MRDPRRDWETYPAGQIPSKASLPGCLFGILERDRVSTILDLGCGTGTLAIELAERGYAVIGVDINPAAVAWARSRASTWSRNRRGARLEFLLADITRLGWDDRLFDAITLQLVLSIIGAEDDRKRLIQQAACLLKPGGILYLSASGVSDAINPRYDELYRQDWPLTGERYSYFSRDPETGGVLYTTHHFRREELETLLSQDFHIELLHREKEVSSRRPSEPAYFFYVIARRRAR